MKNELAIGDQVIPKEDMRLAVLMSTYNGEQYLHQQIASILNQNVDFQVDLWVRDDGSTDQTQIILQHYADQGRLRWYTGENLRAAKSFLDLIHHCPGYDYYAFSDQDDYWYPDKLKNCAAKLMHISEPAISYANARLVDQSLHFLGRNVFEKQPHLDFYSVTCNAGIMGCTMVFNSAMAKLIQSVSIPQDLVMHDYYLGIVCALHDGVIVYQDTPCMDYRQHGQNVVGFARNKIDALKDRIGQLTIKKGNTLDKMAAEICRLYPHVQDMQKWKWLFDVGQYQKSLFSALKLATDMKPHYYSFNTGITARMAFFLRNR